MYSGSINDFYVIKNNVVKQILAEDYTINSEIIKKAYLAHDLGKTIVPGSHFLNFIDRIPPARIIALPAYIGEEFNVAGIKWISSNTKNLEHKLPRASAVIILNHSDTGRPFACLEGSLISSARTAASAVLAAQYLSPKGLSFENLGIIGTGPIAAEIYRYFIQTGWNIKNLTLFDLNPTRCNEFITSIASNSSCNSSNYHKHIATSVEELVKASDGVVFATTSASPYLHDPDLFQHCPLVLNISLRDLGPNVLLSSHNIVDDILHVLAANTAPHLTEQQCGHRHFINGTLGGLIQEKFSLTHEKPIIFSPMGLGILDLALSKYIFDKANAKGCLTKIDHFFED